MSRFSSNGSPTCTLGRLSASSSSSEKPGRCQHADATDAVASGRGAEQHARFPTPEAWPSTSRSLGRMPDAEHIDQRVADIGLVEDRLAADVRDTHRVAVSGDTADDALGHPPAAGVVEGPEPQRVHDGDGPRSHGEDVADDAPDAGGGSLVRLDVAGVVVALDAKRNAMPSPTSMTPAFSPGPDQTCGASVGRRFRCIRERLVRAVLGPHDRVHRKLEVVGVAPQDRDDLVELVVGQAERTVHRFGHARTLVVRLRDDDDLGRGSPWPPRCTIPTCNTSPGCAHIASMASDGNSLKRGPANMTAEHKAALAQGRAEGRAVKEYLEALSANKPKRGRKRTPDSIGRRLEKIAPILKRPVR